MPIPNPQDRKLEALEELHAVIMVKLRTWQHAGPRRDPAAIRAALIQYADGVVALVNSGADE